MDCDAAKARATGSKFSTNNHEAGVSQAKTASVCSNPDDRKHLQCLAFTNSLNNQDPHDSCYHRRELGCSQTRQIEHSESADGRDEAPPPVPVPRTANHDTYVVPWDERENLRNASVLYSIPHLTPTTPLSY
jgi:hypothetical protein